MLHLISLIKNVMIAERNWRTLESELGITIDMHMPQGCSSERRPASASAASPVTAPAPPLGFPLQPGGEDKLVTTR